VCYYERGCPSFASVAKLGTTDLAFTFIRHIRTPTFRVRRVAHPCVLCKGGIPECEHRAILFLISPTLAA
jgi:hypothetical protein